MRSSTLLLHVFVDELHDVLGVRPGAKDGLEAQVLECLGVLFGDDAATEEQDIIDAALLELFDDTREEFEMRAGENAETDDIDVFLEGGFGDHFGRLADAGVDHLAATVAQGAGDDLGTAIMAIEARLRDENADFLCGRSGHCGFLPHMEMSTLDDWPASQS